MYPSQFDYTSVSSVDEAVQLLQQHGEDARLLAGGHSLLPLMKLRLAAPSIVIDLGGVRSLAGVRAQNNHVEIGAMSTYADVVSSPHVRRVSPLIVETANHIGDTQVRNRGTVGGSAAHADPAADMPAAFLALEATFTTRGLTGERTIAASDFFLGPFTSALQPDEVLTGISVQTLPARSGSAYEKFRNPASGYAVVGVVAVVSLAADGSIVHARIAMTGAGSQPTRLTVVEDALRGRAPDAETIQDASNHATDDIEVLGDLFASSDYRHQLARVHTQRALTRAIHRAQA